MKKMLYILIFALGFSLPAQAQFFKKLKKKVQNKVENAITESISDKAESETQKAMDKMLEDAFSGMSLGMETADPALIKDTYDFDWKYVLDMKSKQGEMQLSYRLKKDAPYIGFELPQLADMFMVLDQENKIMIMYMKSDENNFVTATKMPQVEEEDIENQNPYQDIKKIGSKTILGYECDGYQTEDEDHIITFYVTDEAGISFSDMFETNQKNLPKDFDASWLKDGKGLLMEMEMKNKTNPEENVFMTCTKIEKENFSINKSDYASMGVK